MTKMTKIYNLQIDEKFLNFVNNDILEDLKIRKKEIDAQLQYIDLQLKQEDVATRRAELMLQREALINQIADEEINRQEEMLNELKNLNADKNKENQKIQKMLEEQVFNLKKDNDHAP